METVSTPTYLPGNAMRRFRFRFPVAHLNGLNCISGLLMMAFLTGSQNSNVVPPVIVDGPPPHRIYYPKGMISLPCTVHGSMPLTYEWYVNGDLLTPNSKIKIGEDGSLNLNEPDEGYYQCRVSNTAGVAVSNVTFLQAAMCDVMKVRVPMRNINAPGFQSLTLPCFHLIRCIPSAIITWKFHNNTAVHLDDRVTTTENGSLVFTYLLPSDANDDLSSYYRCVVYNPITRREFGGSYHHLTVSGIDDSWRNMYPKILDSSSATVYAIEGSPFSLKCIFEGIPDPSAEWILPSGTKVELRQLDITSAHLSDEGHYTCRKKSTQKVIEVIVDALPRIETNLQSQVAERDSTVRFNCQGVGRPKPGVVWIINGVQSYHDDSLVLTSVNNSLSISCNVSNKYGYQLSSAYLLVVDAAVTTSSHNRCDSTPIPSDQNMTTMTMMTTTNVTTTTTTWSSGGYEESSIKQDRRPFISGHVISLGITPSGNNSHFDLPQGGEVSILGVNKFLFILLIIPVILVVIVLVLIYCRHKRTKKKKVPTATLR